jgi:HTH-type transcriptional regulator/antitoxin HipB
LNPSQITSTGYAKGEHKPGVSSKRKMDRPSEFPISSPVTPSRRAVTSALDIGRIVRDRRLSLEITQQELADAAGTGRRFVSELEAGKPTAELGKVIQVCSYLGLDLILISR